MGTIGSRSLRLPGRLGTALAGGAAATALLVAALAHDGALPLAGRRAPASAPAPRPYDGMLAGKPLQRASCSDWQLAGQSERAGAVRALTATIGGPSTTGGVGTTLPDAEVVALFDRVCGTPQTSGFVLYMIYARAAAFSGVDVAR